MLSNIHFILSHTSHPGNIGASARALKTMGLEHLTLINPKLFPHVDALAMSAGADDILAQAKITSSLDEAIADCHLILGTSARERSLAWSVLDPRAAAEKIISVANKQKIAILFGCEQSGLSNEELQCCHYHVQIPSNPLYSSLNIAAAVQVIAYEIRMAFLDLEPSVQEEETNLTSLATAQQLELFYQHLEKVLFDIEFIKPNHPNRIMQRLRRLLQRTQVEEVELHILRGILNEITRKTKNRVSG